LRYTDILREVNFTVTGSIKQLGIPFLASQLVDQDGIGQFPWLELVLQHNWLCHNFLKDIWALEAVRGS